MKENASSFSKGRLRRLSAEEIALWLEVAKTVSPRPSRVLPQAPAAPARNEVQAEQPAAPGAAKPPEKPNPAKPNQKQPALARKIPPLEPLERRLRQKLSRGRIGPDAAIDLHGLTRHEACVALRHFLGQAQRDGAKLVLVVTGKGRGAGGLFEDEAAGVLRRSVPQWLRGPDYHSIVVGFEEASRPHGGAGALYVRLRRRRPLPE
ncbi:MAG: Smr/MutS family protein [Methylocella sp.]